MLSTVGRALSAVPTFVWLLLGLFGAYLAQLYRHQNAILYHPALPNVGIKRTSDNPPPYNKPSAIGLRYEDVTFQTADGVQLHGWFLPVSTSAPTILFCHGNAGNIGLRMPNLHLLVHKVRANVFIFDYRGYGDSQEVAPTEEGLKLDGAAAIKYLETRSDIDQRKIFMFGRSLGGAVAVHTAVHYPHHVAGLILENTFTSISDMVDALFPVLKYIKSYVLRIYWPTVDIIGRIDKPIMFISGLLDQLVPPPMLRRLYDAASAASFKDLYTVVDGDHNDTFQKAGPAYAVRMRSFIARALETQLGAAARTAYEASTELEEEVTPSPVLPVAAVDAEGDVVPATPLGVDTQPLSLDPAPHLTDALFAK